jgi:hypothetical protein
MFIDGIFHDDKRFQGDAEGLSKFFIAGIHKYQVDRGHTQAGEVTTHVIFAAAMFALGVVVKDLPKRERKKIRDYMISKFDDFMKEHGA